MASIKNVMIMSKPRHTHALLNRDGQRACYILSKNLNSENLSSSKNNNNPLMTRLFFFIHITHPYFLTADSSNYKVVPFKSSNVSQVCFQQHDSVIDPWWY